MGSDSRHIDFSRTGSLYITLYRVLVRLIRGSMVHGFGPSTCPFSSILTLFHIVFDTDPASPICISFRRIMLSQSVHLLCTTYYIFTVVSFYLWMRINHSCYHYCGAAAAGLRDS